MFTSATATFFPDPPAEALAVMSLMVFNRTSMNWVVLVTSPMLYQVRFRSLHGRGDGLVRVTQHAQVMPDYRDSLVGAFLEDIMFSGSHAVAARGGVKVTAAEEEPVGPVWRVLAGGGIGEPIGAVVGGGGEGREEDIEVGFVGGVGSEEGGVWAIMIQIFRCSLSTENVVEGKEEKGKGDEDGEARIHDG